MNAQKTQNQLHNTSNETIIIGNYENKKSLTWEPGAKWGIFSYALKKVWLSINKSYNCQVNNVIVYGDILKY